MKVPSSELSGLDRGLQLEAVYYSFPVPRSPCSLTVLGTVFDRVYFPNVHLPLSGFDPDLLQTEIERIEALNVNDFSTLKLLHTLKFIEHAEILKDLCVFTGSDENPFDMNISDGSVKELHQAIHGPYPSGWFPSFEQWSHKSIPGGSAHITYPDDYHYMVGAVEHSANYGIPLVTDVPGIPVPAISQLHAEDKAKLLSTMLSISCVQLALPELPILSPEHLVEFRSENAKILRSFRAGMLKYAGQLAEKLNAMEVDDLEEEAKFFTQTEILPALEALRSQMASPATPWQRMLTDFGKVGTDLEPSWASMNIGSATAATILKVGAKLWGYAQASVDKNAKIKNSNLYYVLKLKEFYNKKTNRS